MNFKEQLEQAEQRADALLAKIEENSETAKKAYEMDRAEIQADLEELNTAIAKADEEMEAQIEADLQAYDEALDEMDEEFNARLDDRIATAKGNVNAAKENLRLARERRKSKAASTRLKAQMRIEAAKERIRQKKENYDKARQEEQILELLDYAENCQKMAFVMVMDAKHAILEAAAEAADYREKYGE